MLAAIEAAGQTVCLEVYTFSADPLGERFREALVRAQQRGARVQVLFDALGSYGLAGAFWQPLRVAGGEVRVFNHEDMDLGKGRNGARRRGIGACVRKAHLFAHQHRTWILC